MSLPSSGNISLNQIKAEFKKGNNLTSYYGVTSGIPSGGPIRITDFYGKSNVVDPGGQFYNLSGDYEVWREDISKENRWITLAKGYGQGNPVSLPSTMGYMQRSPDGSYPPPDNQAYGPEFFVEAQRIAGTLNTYRTLRVTEGSGGVQDFNNGTWSEFDYSNMVERNQDGSEKPGANKKIFSVTRMSGGSPTLTQHIKSLLSSNGNFSMYFMDPTRTAREILELGIENSKMREGF